VLLNSVTGEVVLNGDVDFELDQQFHLTIEAIDNGAVQLTDTMDLFVYIRDVNDNAPVFDASYGPYR